MSSSVSRGRFAYITHPDCVKHEMGAGHPECPDRIKVIHQGLIDRGLLDGVQSLVAPLVSAESLARVHTQSYLNHVHEVAPFHGSVALDPDTSMNPFSLSAAKHAAGAGVLAVDSILSGQIDRAFCNVRPPGHHAELGKAMGFCIYNNVAVAAAHALANGIERVAIVDWDVHHGNGTESWVAQEPRALMLGSFQHPYYPGTGKIALAPNCINVPLDARSTNANLKDAVNDIWWPAIDSFAPQLIFISAGFDAHNDDDMSGLSWSDADYTWLSQTVLAMAQKHCGGRIVSLLEGGYDLAALQRCVGDHVSVLAQNTLSQYIQ